MALREIIWTVSKDVRSLTPNTPQDGGVQGEHNATTAVFVIPDGCALRDEKYQLYYTWVNASGCYDKTEPLSIEAGRVSFDLPREWTQYGGINTITLVAEADGEVVYTLEGRVTFHSRQTAHKRERHLLEGFMQEKCDEAAAHVAAAKFHEQNADEYNEEAKMWARDAANAAADAESAAEQAAQSANTAEYHGRYADEAALAAKEYAAQAERAAKEAAEAIPVVDDKLSDTSTNPVQNKVVDEAIRDVGSIAQTAISGTGAAHDRLDILEGKGLLIVTYTNVDDMTATHNAAEIYAHIQNGGTAVFFDGSGTYYNLTFVEQSIAAFSFVGDDFCNTLFLIDDSAGVEVVDLQYASSGLVQELYDRVINLEENSVGNIDTALDSIIAIQEKLIGTITFTDGINTFTALKGMTFGEWVDSKYNTIGATVNNANYIWWPEGASTLAPDSGAPVTSTDVILDGAVYEWQ